MLSIILILLVVMISVIFVRYLSMAAAGGMTLKTVISLIGVILPGYISLLIPISYFLSIVIVYGKMFADSELTVMFACGLSWLRLTWYTLIPGFVLTVIVALLSLFVMPSMNYHKDNLKHISAEGANSLNLVETGRFISLNGSQEVAYIGKTNIKGNQSRDIFIFRNLPSGMMQLILAPSGYMHTDKTGKAQFLVLQSGHVYRFLPGQLNVQLSHFEQYSARMLHPNYRIQRDDLGAFSTAQLLQHPNDAKWSEFEWRMALPLAMLVIIFLGVAICYIAPRRGRYTKIINAILIFIVYFNFISMARSWITNGVLSPWLGMWVIHLVFFLIAMYWILRLEGIFGRLVIPVPLLKQRWRI